MTELKSLPWAVKSINGRVVTGIASVFGVIDSYDDIVWPGSFAKTLREQAGRIKHLWQHDMWEPPIAVIKSLREISLDDLPDSIRAKYPEAMGGLEVTREYLETERGNEILAGLKTGAITEMSFMYNTVKYDFEEIETDGRGKVQVRNLRELRLWETSDVLWGANEATVASKSKDPVALRMKTLIDQIEKYQELVKENSRDLDAARLKTALNAVKTALEPTEPVAKINHSDYLRLKMRAAEQALGLQK